MRVAVLGTGGVGQTLTGRIASLGHEVMMGTRDVEAALARTEAGYGSTPLYDWSAEHRDVALGTFAEVAAFGELVINATSGTGTLEALAAAGAENLDGKILIDVANPLDFSHGMPPTLSVCNTDSLGEQIQRAFPGAKVVKTLNTVTAAVMVDPGSVGGGDHHLFLSGDDAEAKGEVTRILQEWFGWRHVLDLGGIETSRGAEMYLPLWLTLFSAQGSPMLNVKVVT